MSKFADHLKSCPVIPAVRDKTDIKDALTANAKLIFILSGDISGIGDLMKTVKRGGKLGLIHIDLIDGLGKDDAGVKFLARRVGADGIVSTRANLINSAKREGMIAVQRLFMLDSSSLETGIKISNQSNCDAVEVLPGLVLPELMVHLSPAVSLPIIGGGLITEAAQVSRILGSGAIGVSTGERSLWGWGGS